MMYSVMSYALSYIIIFLYEFYSDMTVMCVFIAGRVNADESQEKLSAFKKHALEYYCSAGLAILFVVLWPLLAVPVGVFSESYFTFWIAITITWCLLSTAIIIIAPLYESREVILHTLKGIIRAYRERYDDNSTTDVDEGTFSTDTATDNIGRNTDIRRTTITRRTTTTSPFWGTSNKRSSVLNARPSGLQIDKSVV